MIDAHEFAGAPQAFKALDAALDSVMKYLPPGPLSRAEQYARPHTDESFCWDEPYTLPENFFLAWQRGAGSRYKDMGKHFLADSWYWDPLAAGENVLPGKHAYSHVNAMSSAMQAYFVLGNEKYLRAARNGFDFVRAQSFATGGWGPDEEFRKPGSGEIGESLTKTHSSFETPCGSYAHFKITRYLLRATKDSRYGDSMERVLYNCILGAKPIKEDGHGFYYSDYNNDGSKFYHPYKWHCCTGTFSQVTADYGISSYFRDDEGVYVNLFVPSRVTWKRGSDRVVLTQRTEYPHRPSTQIEVAPDKSSAFAVFVRIPEWAGPKTTHRSERQASREQPESRPVRAHSSHVEEGRSDRSRVRHANHASGCRPAASKAGGRGAWTSGAVCCWRYSGNGPPKGIGRSSAGRGRFDRLAGEDGCRRDHDAAVHCDQRRTLPVVPGSARLSDSIPG